jgi:8-amino-7-oxononanoate synthase
MSGYRERIQEKISPVHTLRDNGAYTYNLAVSSGCGPTMIVEGRERINFISNSYMGFSIHPKVIAAAHTAADEYGIGIGGSPVACGTTKLHLRLAERLATNYGKEAALIFTTGYQALAGTIQGMLTRNDIALIDSLAHRSIVDGCVLAGCKVRSFKHNDPSDLEELIGSTARHDVHRMVIVDSVYSMDGDIAPLPRLNEICRPAGVTIMIDEAHCLGIMGKTGKGLFEHFDLPNGADIVAGTFSKFAGAIGGFAAADRDVIDYLRHFSSPFVFSASLPPTLVAAILAAFDLLDSEPEWRTRLWENVNFVLTGLKQMGFDTGPSKTPVIPIMIRDTIKTFVMTKELFDRGVYCSPVVHPGVPVNQDRLRLGVMASHTRAQLERALSIFQEVGRKFEVIP